MKGRGGVGGSGSDGGRGRGERMKYSNACLTMHQPWASLLVHGIKRVEGRSWPAPLKGRLWIHAASKVPDLETIKAMEDFYSQIYAVDGITDIKFPEHYPVSRLIGHMTEAPTKSKQKEPDPSAASEEPCFSRCITKAPTESELAAEAAPRKVNFEMSGNCSTLTKEERQYIDLTVNWKPPPLLMEKSDIGDEEWLFGTRKQRQQQQKHPFDGAKGCGDDGGSSISGDLGHERPESLLQPRACYLPAVDMYQLPYAIPF